MHSALRLRRDFGSACVAPVDKQATYLRGREEVLNHRACLQRQLRQDVGEPPLQCPPACPLKFLQARHLVAEEGRGARRELFAGAEAQDEQRLQTRAPGEHDVVGEPMHLLRHARRPGQVRDVRRKALALGRVHDAGVRGHDLEVCPADV